MTKTKKQLRAEAVQRLRSIPNECMNATSVVVAIAGEAAYRLGGTRDARDMCIDLLTDDDSTTHEVESTTELLSDGADSRAKLEEDANAVAIDYWQRERTWGDANDLKRDVIALLDRQASITEREILSHPDERDEQIAELQQQVDELSERKCPGYDPTRHYCKYHAQDFGLNDRTVSRLKRENSALARDLKTARAVNEQQDLEYTENKKRIADLKQQVGDLRGEWHRVCAERANLARDLGECMADRDRYRALCGQMLDAAHEIRRIADANMPEVAKEVLK